MIKKGKKNKNRLPETSTVDCCSSIVFVWFLWRIRETIKSWFFVWEWNEKAWKRVWFYKGCVAFTRVKGFEREKDQTQNLMLQRIGERNDVDRWAMSSPFLHLNLKFEYQNSKWKSCCAMRSLFRFLKHKTALQLGFILWW